MATRTIGESATTVVRRRTLGETYIGQWLTTTDHKMIGLMYIITGFLFFLVGGLEALLIRAELARPDGKLLSPDVYNQIFTMHGVTMIFLFVMPTLTGLGNYVVPLMIGARDMAFPRMNAFGFWTTLFAGVFLQSSFLFGSAPNAGWFNYTPLSTAACGVHAVQCTAGMNDDFWLLGIMLLGVASIASGLNFVVTILKLRAPGMSINRMPLFSWMTLVTSFLLLFALPSLTAASILLLLDRRIGTHFYQYAFGGDPLLWQHFFWSFGHPEVYILILPAFGLVSEILPTFSRKPLFGYPVMVYSGILIAFLGFGVWAHHMFAVGMGPIADTLFAVTTMLIGIPTGVKIFNWIFTMWGGDLRFTTAMKFAIGLVALFTIGGISGV